MRGSLARGFLSTKTTSAIIANVGGHALPLAIPPRPGQHHGPHRLRATLDRLFKVMPELGLTITHFIADAGHDGEANHRYCLDHDVRAVKPLRGEVAAAHSEEYGGH